MTDCPDFSNAPPLVELSSCSGASERKFWYFCLPSPSANVSLPEDGSLPLAASVPAAPESEPITDPRTMTLIAPPPHVNSASLPPGPSPWSNTRTPGSDELIAPSLPASTLVSISPVPFPALLHLRPVPAASQPVNFVTLFAVVVALVTSPSPVPPVHVILDLLAGSRNAEPSVAVNGIFDGAVPPTFAFV